MAKRKPRWGNIKRIDAGSAVAVSGVTVAEILNAYPDLEPEDIQEALRYAAEAVRERELPLRIHKIFMS